MKHSKTIEQKVINLLKTQDLLAGSKNLLIGLSGGADSVFAILFFLKYSKKYQIDFSAIHINHNLRGNESDEAEVFCRKFCEDREIEFISRSVNVDSFAKINKISIEEAARELRYAEFSKVVKQRNFDLVVTAHNSDDNAETVLLNIIQGSGLHGISGIPTKRDNIIRPFLCLTKAEIMEYLSVQKVDHKFDGSNDNIEFRRNYLRNEVIPLLKENINPNLSTNILNSSFVLKNQRKTLDYLIRSLVESLLVEKEDSIELNLTKIDDHPEFLYGEIIKWVFENKLNLEFNYSQFEKFSSIIDNQVGKLVELGSGWNLIRDRKKIIISKNKPVDKIYKKVPFGSTIKVLNNKIKIELVDSFDKELASNPKVEFISGDRINTELCVRNWEKGDKIKPLGMKGTKKISDVLTDLKIPVSERKNQLVLLHENDIVYLFGKYISEKYKITSNTKRIIKICLN